MADGDAAPEPEVLREEDDQGEGGDDNPQQKTPTSNSKKGKRQWAKVEAVGMKITDFYSPAAYTSTNKGGGKGKGSKGDRGDGEGGRKGKGKGYYQDGEASQKPTVENSADGAPSVAPGPQTAADGDPSQQKGGSNTKNKKQMKGNREGGKGGKGGAGGGKNQQQAPRKGAPGGKGPRPPMPASEMAEQEAEGPRTPGPQRVPVPAKGAAPGGVVGMPVAGAPYSYGMPYPYAGHMAMPYPGGPMPAMYALPYYVMPSPNMAAAAAPQPYGMPAAAAPPAGPQPAPIADRAGVTSQVQKQIEYYFGMENLLKDVFLRKHMTDEGYVPIALLAGFRRIQSMISSDPSILMDAISTSQLVELNPENTHVRLRNDWQKWILAPGGAAGAAPPASPGAPAQAAIRSP